MMSILTCILAVFVSTGITFAQSASETARTYFDLLKDGEYREAAKLFEPDALREIRKSLNFGQALPDEVAKQFYLQFFGAGATRESVSRLSDSEFFAKFLSSLARQGEEVGVNAFGKVVILGEVAEGKDIVHVLTRQFPVEGPATLDVVSFRKSNGTWKAMLTEKLKGLADQPKKAIQMWQKALQMQEKLKGK